MSWLHRQNNTVIVGPGVQYIGVWEFWPGSSLVPIGMDLPFKPNSPRRKTLPPTLCLYEEVIWSSGATLTRVLDTHQRWTQSIDRDHPETYRLRFMQFQHPLPALQPGFSGDVWWTASTNRQVNPKTLLRGLTRHWWLILLVWLCLSLPFAMYLIHQLVEPTFEASSILRITPTSWTLYEPSEQIDFRGAAPYLQTQVGLITSDRVLQPAAIGYRLLRSST